MKSLAQGYPCVGRCIFRCRRVKRGFPLSPSGRFPRLARLQPAPRRHFHQRNKDDVLCRKAQGRGQRILPIMLAGRNDSAIRAVKSSFRPRHGGDSQEACRLPSVSTDWRACRRPKLEHSSTSYSPMPVRKAGKNKIKLKIIKSLQLWQIKQPT